MSLDEYKFIASLFSYQSILLGSNDFDSHYNVQRGFGIIMSSGGYLAWSEESDSLKMTVIEEYVPISTLSLFAFSFKIVRDICCHDRTFTIEQ